MWITGHIYASNFSIRFDDCGKSTLIQIGSAVAVHNNKLTFKPTMPLLTQAITSPATDGSLLPNTPKEEHFAPENDPVASNLTTTERS